jgi:mannitol-1-phosphate/altronate dehydrogenase
MEGAFWTPSHPPFHAKGENRTARPTQPRKPCPPAAAGQSLHPVERSAAQKTVSVIGSLTGVVFAGESSAALMEATDRRAIRIVSLTVTKHGYCLNRSAKQLDPDHPLIRQDLAHPERPSSTIGIVVEACRRQESRVPRRAPLREIHQPH